MGEGMLIFNPLSFPLDILPLIEIPHLYLGGGRELHIPLPRNTLSSLNTVPLLCSCCVNIAVVNRNI